MRKILLFIAVLSITAAWMVGCGDSAKKVVVVPATPLPNVAFLQGPADMSDMLTPMLGTFTSSGQFVTKAVMDTDNKPVTAEINSIALSADRTKATLDLYGGLDGNSDQWDIWVAKSDLSTNPTQITNDVYDDVLPQFSHDGAKIAYASYRPIPGDINGDYQWQIVVRNASAGGTELVLPIPAGVWYQMHPTFSPDGTKIAMMADGYWNDIPFAGIMITNADGSNPQALTNPLYTEACYYCQDELPTFTADGTKIVFSRDNWNQSPEVADIYVMNAADGSNLTQLTDGVGLNSDPLAITISSLGESILFNSNRENLDITTSGGFCLYSMKTDGTGLTRLTNNTLFDGFSTWWYGGPGDAAAARHASTLSHRYQPLHRVTPLHGWNR